jgi:phosphoribosyl 1,2-cyclic phosphodiesterase
MLVFLKLQIHLSIKQSFFYTRQMKIKIWGSRGSIPSALEPKQLENRITDVVKLYSEQKFDVEEFLKTLPRHLFGGFGGNTTCVEVTHGSHQLIIDGGSGLRNCGINLLSGPLGKGQGKVHIYMTHFHWDHIMGIPFFIPIFIPGNEIHFYAVDPNLAKHIELIFTKPYFPVPFKALGAKIVFHTVAPREAFMMGEMKCTPYLLDHPDPCWGLRIEAGGKSFGHCVDNEATRMSQAKLGPDLPFYQNLDLLYFDAQYSLQEQIDRVNWGHASSQVGMDIAIREKVKKIIFTHHDPMAHDQKIKSFIDNTREYAKYLKENNEGEIQWDFAYDGMEIEL